MNVYEHCPTLTQGDLTLRLVESGDAAALVKVYGDERATALCNSDNCHYGAFHIPTEEAMAHCIDAWLAEYRQGWFVRWTVVHGGEAVGTIELFRRESADAFHQHGILRVDLRPDCETEPFLTSLLALIHRHAYDLFDCGILATKATPAAAVRRRALAQSGYLLSENRLAGNDGTLYGDYWVRPVSR